MGRPVASAPPEFMITRLGRVRRRRPLAKLALAAGIVAVAAGGSTLLVLRPASHETARTTPRHVTQPPASAPWRPHPRHRAPQCLPDGPAAFNRADPAGRDQAAGHRVRLPARGG